mgnify:CR=1 FL=1
MSIAAPKKTVFVPPRSPWSAALSYSMPLTAADLVLAGEHLNPDAAVGVAGDGLDFVVGGLLQLSLCNGTCRC